MDKCNNINDLRLNIIYAEKLNKTNTHRDFIKKSILKEKFWFYTSERFLYIDDFMQQYDMKHVFHLENDNLLYVNLQEIKKIYF